MKKKTIIKILLGALILQTVSGYGLYMKGKYEAPKKVVTQESRVEYNITKEAIIEELKENISVNVLSICMKTETQIDKSPIKLEAFKRIGQATFYGQVDYCINMQNICKENIRVEDNNITVYMGKPQIKSYINRSEYKTEKGWLTFKDVECPPDELLRLEEEVREGFLIEGAKEDNMIEAKCRVSNAIESILKTFTNNEYNVKVVFAE